MFTRFESIQFVEVDLDKHPRFRSLIKTVQQKHQGQINVLALVTPQNKYTIFDNTDELEGWLEDLAKGDESVHVNLIVPFSFADARRL